MIDAHNLYLVAAIVLTGVGLVGVMVAAELATNRALRAPKYGRRKGCLQWRRGLRGGLRGDYPTPIPLVNFPDFW